MVHSRRVLMVLANAGKLCIEGAPRNEFVCERNPDLKLTDSDLQNLSSRKQGGMGEALAGHGSEMRWHGNVEGL